MNSNVTFQIVIPYYKEFDYFTKALSSVLLQDYSVFTVLIIDDGTHDQRVTDHVDSLNDSRIMLLHNEKNIGLPNNFELARSLAKADYIVFLGQDDILEPNYISSIHPWVSAQNSVAITQPKVLVIDESGKDFLPVSDFVKSLLFRLAWKLGRTITSEGKLGSLLDSKRSAFVLLIGDFLYFPTITWKTSSMKSFDVSREVTLDYKMIIDVLAEGGELLLLPNQIARYRRHKRSASMKPERMIDRLNEEKAFHIELKGNSFVRNSLLLRTVNSIRFTQRLHVLQFSAESLLRRDWRRSIQALRCL